MFVYAITVAPSFNSELIMERCKSGVVYFESVEALGSGFRIYEEGWVGQAYRQLSITAELGLAFRGGAGKW